MLCDCPSYSRRFCAAPEFKNNPSPIRDNSPIVKHRGCRYNKGQASMTAGIMSGKMIMLLLPGRTAENEKQERYQNETIAEERDHL